MVALTNFAESESYGLMTVTTLSLMDITLVNLRVDLQEANRIKLQTINKKALMFINFYLYVQTHLHSLQSNQFHQPVTILFDLLFEKPSAQYDLHFQWIELRLTN